MMVRTYGTRTTSYRSRYSVLGIGLVIEYAASNWPTPATASTLFSDGCWRSDLTGQQSRRLVNENESSTSPSADATWRIMWIISLMMALVRVNE